MKETIKSFLADGIGRIADYFVLNLLFILTCLPVITIGTSCSAMYYVVFHIMEEEDSHLTRKYFKTWKECFIKDTIIWVISLILFFLLFEAVIMMASLPINVMTLFLYAIVLIVFFSLCTCMIYYFSLHARFENTIVITLKNSLILIISHLPVSAMCFAILIAPVAVLYIFPSAGYFVTAFMLLFGFALQNYMQSRLLFPIYLEL